MTEMEKLVSDQDMAIKAALEALISDITTAINNFSSQKDDKEIILDNITITLNEIINEINILINDNLANIDNFTNQFKIIYNKLQTINNNLTVIEKEIKNYNELTITIPGDIDKYYPILFDIFNKSGELIIERTEGLDTDIFLYNSPQLYTAIKYEHRTNYPVYFNLEYNIQRYKNTINLISDKVFSCTNENISNISEWNFYSEINNTTDYNDIKSDVVGGNQHTIALKEDGTCIATGYNNNGECNVQDWTDIKQIACGSYHTAALKEDGTCIATGKNNYYQCDISNWTDIKYIACGRYITLGVKSDGTVVYSGTIFDSSDALLQFSTWTNIKKLSAGLNHIVGLKEDNTCVGVQAVTNNYGQGNVSEFIDVHDISCGTDFTIGLKSDGTCYFTGKNLWNIKENLELAASYNIKIIYGKCGADHVVGITDDGMVISIGRSNYNQNATTDWPGVIKICAAYYASMAIKSDGSILYTGREDYGQNDISSWQLFPDIGSISVYLSSFYIRGGLTYKFKSTDEFVLEDIQNSINRIGTNNAEYNFLSDYIVKELNEDDVAYINNDELYKEHKRYGHYSVGPYYFEQRFDKFIPKYITSIKPVIYEPTEGSVITTPTIEVLASRPDFLDIGDSISEIQIVEGIDLDFSEIKTTILTDADFIIDGNGNISFTFESSLGSNEANLYFVVRYKGVNYGVTEYSDITQVTCSFIIPTELAKPEVIRFEKAWEARGVNIIITPPEYVHGDGIVTEVYLEYDNNNTGNPLYHSYIALNTLTFTDGEYCIDMADYSFEWSSANNVSARIKYTDNNNVESPWSDVLTTLIIG
jgi:alpha-tubulin suppressor-like RCC1 family protein